MQRIVSLVALPLTLSIVGCSGGTGDASGAQESLGTSGDALHGNEHETPSVDWSESTLAAIASSGYGATIAARAIAEVHTAAYDAWSAYSDLATPTQPSVTRQPASARTDANKRVAMSQAAYDVLVDLFPAQQTDLAKRLKAFGGDPGNMATTGTSPVAIGNAAAAAIIAVRHQDASNQLGDITPGAYSDYTGYAPVNTPTTVLDPNRWQPLVVNGATQSFLTPQWQNVIPFALTDPTAFRPPPPPQFGSVDYRAEAEHLIDVSASLDDRAKVIAEYWTDGPGTSTAAGHWARLAEVVSARDRHSIDDDAKMFFALGNALLDTSISVWEAKRFYDYVRPITAIRYLYAGKKIVAWGGPNQGTRTIDGAQWRPYDPANEVTPASAEYPAEESAFAFAAARVLVRFTGDERFGADYVAEENSSVIEKHVPKHDVRLCWAQFEDAARQAGRAGQLRGVHFAGSDHAGRALGRQVGDLVWTTALGFFHEANPSHAPARWADCDRDDQDDPKDDE
jgi:hypothetical protein